MGLCCLAVCGNGAHQRHHGTRIHQIVILADPRPAQLIVVAALKEAGFRADAADIVCRQQSGIPGITLQGIAAQLCGKVRKNAVAGVGKRLLKVHGAVNIRAGDDVAADFRAAGAGKGAFLHIGDVFQRRGSGDDFKYRARGIQTRQETVEIDAAVLLVIIGNVGRIGRVIGRGGDHAKDVAGFVIVYGHHAFTAVKRLVGGFVQLGVNGQIQLVSAAGGAGDRVKAHQVIAEE